MTTEILNTEEKDLVLERFTHQDAFELGLIIVALAKENDVNVAVHIEKNRIPLFTHLMDGTTEENYQWLFRKKRVVDHYQKSSAFIDARFKESGGTHAENSLLAAETFQAVGGSIPLRVTNAGVVGTLTVAGLTGELDHLYAVEGVRRYINKHDG
ncbi:heme-binding protein [Exiguobacterium indicum]|uniref:heme-binding protein n=1 Tax=Exiguobacterium indicum TaxID=296995 RepID=UPI0033156DFD